MKRAMLILLLALLVTAPALARGGRGESKRGGGKDASCESLPLEEVDAKEEADLLYIREEEKLARDVYLTLYDVHRLQIFKNISASEQRHMDALLGLLVKYEIEDPVGDNAVGVFKNQDLRALYVKLVAAGKVSEIAALTVGATIEDLDINDLAHDIAGTDNEDLTMVYENLMRGSRNHMRAFTRQLNSRDVTYVPSYISQEDYDEIIDSPQERGKGGSDGKRKGRGGGKGRGNGGGRGQGRCR